MVRYPVFVPRRHYRGSKDRLRRKITDYNRVAAELEAYLNRQIEASDEDTQVLFYEDIARATGVPLDMVRDILFGVDCGHNGLTVHKPQRSAPL
jgi:hypothetical protein